MPLLLPRQVMRMLLPVSGAAANAADAMRADDAAVAGRRNAALSQARAVSHQSWSSLPDGRHRGPAHGLALVSGDADQIARLCDFVLDGLAGGETCLVVATPSHLTGLRHRLALLGVEPAPGLLVELDAEEVVSVLLRDGRVDADLFERFAASMLRGLVAGGATVRGYGEMVQVLHARGDLQEAVRLEELWEGLLQELPITLLCPYRVDGDEQELSTSLAPLHTHVLV